MTDRDPSAATKRGELERKLADLDQDLADLYHEAVDLLNDTRYNRAVVMMLSHAVRELANNLAHHLGLMEGIQFPASVDTSTPIGTLARLWEAEGFNSPNSSTTNSSPGLVELTEGLDETIREKPPVRITEGIYAAIETLIAAHSRVAANARQRQAFIAAGNSATPHDPTAKLFGATFDFFMSYAHLDRAAGRRLPTAQELQNQFANFEAVVSARIGGFFDVVDELADIIEIANAANPRNEAPPDQATDAQ
ncbi:hypothetical protein ACFWPQ_51800 [Streptomyces sp. NPDC058464]|uniref:hypothetical protein n=1 Tax=Streptomyces sp. NPDC058464 TaxID=3346511 RepID=UPI0036653614